MKDWRLQIQEKYLQGVTLIFRKYKKRSEQWEHDHCEFCGAKFAEDDNADFKEGYCTEDEYHWICPTCFEDFKEKFQWTVKRPE